MNERITRKMLVDWAGEQVVRDAESMADNQVVQEARYEHPELTGTVLWNNRELKTGLTIISPTTVENHCPCWANRERGVICAHAIALGVSIVRRSTDPMRDVRYKEELRRASRLAAVNEALYLRRVPPETAGAFPAQLQITLDPDWLRNAMSGPISIQCHVIFRGHPESVEQIPRDIPLSFKKRDESLLFVLEDICEGPVRNQIALSVRDFINLLKLCPENRLLCDGETPITIGETEMTTHINMDLDRENGEIILIAHTEIPFLKPGAHPVYFVSGNSGWVYGANHFWPLRNILPEPCHAIYREPVIIKRHDIQRFLTQDLSLLTKFARIESDLSPELFQFEPARPQYHLAVKGSPASLAATVYALYGETRLIAGKPDAQAHFAIPDPTDLLRYEIRNPDAEKQALAVLANVGFKGDWGDDLSPIVGNREVLNFLGRDIPALRRRGWKITLEGRVDPLMNSLSFALPVVHIGDISEGKWFDVGFDFEDGSGQSLSASDIQRALRKGDAFLEHHGQTWLIDAEAIESMQKVFHDCPTTEGEQAGHFRLPALYAPFVKSSLDALDGVDVEETPIWKAATGYSNRTVTIEPVEIRPPLGTILREYQKTGVYWLRFLEKSGFCGLLADEMGLGKTLQTLAWINMERLHPDAAGKPVLIVCPTSLVENWEEETRRFVPSMKILTLSGSDRHAKWKDIPRQDVVVTSYAILRRDANRLAELEFAALVLDEAQHIKNRSTQNALAAKSLKTFHRLVLTGTPVENGVADIWSIMDFLMPDYLGSHESFRRDYELPIAKQDKDGATAQTRLRRKLHPFILRRMKAEVARDLPPKIEKISLCTMTTDQQLVYTELLNTSRRKIQEMVAEQGFGKCRMQILATLMRLRQACCHLDLLKLPDLKPQYPSGKMELFFELMDEALDGGHRVLVFSQFVSMLKILQSELNARNIAYCYLDGSTQNRMSVVRQFNTERSIPVFLISLKAGGTGLNLTGADMVIHFDPWWNPAVEDQATDRAYRIGQKNTVYSIKLITQGTVEEKVLELQQRKKQIIQATLESDDEAMIKNLQWEDIRDILNL